MRIILAAAVAIAAAVFTAPIAGADPDPAPPPIIPTPGGGAWLPANQTYQPVCATFPQACGFRYSPDTGTWQPRG